MFRPTYAEIDLSAFRYNFQQLKERVSPSTDILAVVKANAYGHGIKEISCAAVESGAKILGISSIEEGIYLRENGIKVPLLILGSIYPLENFEKIIEHNLTPTISSLNAAHYLSQIAIKKNRIQKVHIKVDTGMGRIGLRIDKAKEIIEEISTLKNIKIEGVYSHLASADFDQDYTIFQLKEFNNLINSLSPLKIKYFHIANSSAILKYPQAHFNLVRPGISLYGIPPFPGANIELKPVMKFKTRIVYLKKVPAGSKISYGGRWTALHPSLIATLPVGYADGYSRSLSGKASVLIRGKLFKIVGTICMDMCMVDVSEEPQISLGEEVVLFGKQEENQIKVEEIASLIGTIPYEILCNINNRVPRIYV